MLPSVAHAAAAAVLRSGYLADDGENGERPFAIDLQSDRVRLAEWLLDGVREGQSLSELLGYRFERPATASLDTMDALAAARVADGLELARLFQQGSFPFVRVAPSIPLAQRQQLETELAGLHAAVDAVGDALTAEGVYQVVRGNPARAAASVDAVAHGDVRPPDLQVNQTPRPGTTQTHRLLVLFSGAVAAAATPRAVAEPALDGWLRQMIGDLRRVRYRSEF